MAEEGPRLFNARWKGAEQGADSLKAGSKQDSPQESLLVSGRASRGQRGGNQRAISKRKAMNAVSICIGAGVGGGGAITLLVAHF